MRHPHAVRERDDLGDVKTKIHLHPAETTRIDPAPLVRGTAFWMAPESARTIEVPSEMLPSFGAPPDSSACWSTRTTIERPLANDLGVGPTVLWGRRPVRPRVVVAATLRAIEVRNGAEPGREFGPMRIQEIGY